MFLSNTIFEKLFFIWDHVSKFYPCYYSSGNSLKKSFILTRFTDWRTKKYFFSHCLIITSLPYQVFDMTTYCYKWNRKIYLKGIDIFSEKSKFEVICFKYLYFCCKGDSHDMDFFVFRECPFKELSKYLKLIFWGVNFTPHRWFFAQSGNNRFIFFGSQKVSYRVYFSLWAMNIIQDIKAESSIKKRSVRDIENSILIDFFHKT
jgi:hypothetical protein